MVRRRILMGLAVAVLVAGWASAEETIEELKEKALQERPRLEPPYPGPFLLTSVGQGAGASVAKALLTVKANLPLDFNPTVTAEEITGTGTLLVVAGASAKGLGAAGINKNAEMKRAEAMLGAAREAKIPIVLMHIGGKERRGELSDPFIELAVPFADYLIVKKDGNQDGYFTRKSEELRIPLKEIEKYQDLNDAVLKIVSLSGVPGRN